MLSQSGEGHGYIFNESAVVHAHTHTHSYAQGEQAGVSVRGCESAHWISQQGSSSFLPSFRVNVCVCVAAAKVGRKAVNRITMHTFCFNG